MKKEETGNLAETAYNMILDRIIKFSLSPGSSISDFTLSKELGISRTPVREAILKLVDDGLVERKVHGFQVADITAEEIIDLYDAREGTETVLLKLAMQKGIHRNQLEHLRELNRSLADCIAQKDIIKALEFDTQIHGYLANCSGNRRLLSFYNRIAKQTMRMSIFSIAQGNQFAAHEHEQLFLSIEDGDIEKACDALRVNISRAKDQHLHVLETSMREGWIGIARFVYRPVPSSSC